MMPYRQLHENEEVYGPDVLEFDAERFLKNPGLRRSTSFRPFGGGSTYCPGRYAARQEVVGFVALVVYRLEISLVKGEDGEDQSFPRMESSKPSFGMMGVVKGDDLVVKVCSRV
jgi:cytochrome P450